MAKIPQVRIAVNARCGRACFFCRPSGESIPTAAGTMLDVDTVVTLCSAFQVFGACEFKLTGGDPALWPPLIECVHRLKHDVGVAHLEVISRHPSIGSLAGALQSAGVDQINLSMDTLKSETHRRITGVDDLGDLQEALRKVVRAGVPCKINTVVMHGVNDAELQAIVRHCEAEGVTQLKMLDVIRDLDNGAESFKGRLVQIGAYTMRDLYTPLDGIVEWLEEQATSNCRVVQGGLGHPMRSYRMPSGLNVVVKDHRAGAWYSNICASCRHYPCHDALMAIRVTSDRRIQFCLLREDTAIDLGDALREGANALQATIRAALDVYASATFAAPLEVL